MSAFTSPSHDADFDSAVLGGGLPAEVEALITQAGLVRSDRAQAEPLLMQARALAPDHPATMIALYRFHFYGHRLQEARQVALDALAMARAALGEELKADDEKARFDAATRFYLFSLKGYAYLSLRLGDTDVGKKALAELQALDPQDRVGGGVLTHVLARVQADDLEDPFSTPIAPRGWSTP